MTNSIYQPVAVLGHEIMILISYHMYRIHKIYILLENTAIWQAFNDTSLRNIKKNKRHGI